jgi:hypothetical protein
MKHNQEKNLKIEKEEYQYQEVKNNGNYQKIISFKL